LVAALTAVIYWAGRGLGVHEFPVVIAMLFALVIAMPLGIWLFGPLRRRATAGLEVATERRRRDREQLRARLRGEAPPDD
jgi:ABC-type proline/glycine betaine transport system permease subunit